MDKVKRILAMIGVIILVGMYIGTLICALSASENFMSMLMASIYASLIIPVIIWAFTHFAGLFSRKGSDEADSNETTTRK